MAQDSLQRRERGLGLCNDQIKEQSKAEWCVNPTHGSVRAVWDWPGGACWRGRSGSAMSHSLLGCVPRLVARAWGPRREGDGRATVDDTIRHDPVRQRKLPHSLSPPCAAPSHSFVANCCRRQDAACMLDMAALRQHSILGTCTKAATAAMPVPNPNLVAGNFNRRETGERVDMACTSRMIVSQTHAV